MYKKFLISGFADEIDPNVNLQFEHLNKLGISYFEPRGIDGINIANLTDDQVEELKEKMQNHSIKISSIGSPIGKIKITDDFEEHFEKFKRVVEIANKLDAPYIRMFSFYIPEGTNPAEYKEDVLKKLSKMVEYAESNNVILLHENEKDIYGDNAQRCLDIFENIKSDHLKAVFDFANFVQVGQETLSAYEMLKPYIQYIHIKDALLNGDVVPAGFGNGNVEAILKDLIESGYNGFLSLEPHLGSFTGLADLQVDSKILELEESGPEKFTLAYESLIKILERLGE